MRWFTAASMNSEQPWSSEEIDHLSICHLAIIYLSIFLWMNEDNMVYGCISKRNDLMNMSGVVAPSKGWNLNMSRFTLPQSGWQTHLSSGCGFNQNLPLTDHPKLYFVPPHRLPIHLLNRATDRSQTALWKGWWLHWAQKHAEMRFLWEAWKKEVERRRKLKINPFRK